MRLMTPRQEEAQEICPILALHKPVPLLATSGRDRLYFLYFLLNVPILPSL